MKTTKLPDEIRAKLVTAFNRLRWLPAHEVDSMLAYVCNGNTPTNYPDMLRTLHAAGLVQPQPDNPRMYWPTTLGALAYLYGPRVDCMDRTDMVAKGELYVLVSRRNVATVVMRSRPGWPVNVPLLRAHFPTSWPEGDVASVATARLIGFPDWFEAVPGTLPE